MIDTRDHDLAGCRRRHGHVGPVAGLPCEDDCGCRCHVPLHVFTANPDIPTICNECERPPSDRLHTSETTALCAWPANGRTPPVDAPDAYIQCEAPIRGHTAISGHRGPVWYSLPVCPVHLGNALGAGWTVRAPDGPEMELAIDMSPLIPNAHGSAPRLVPDPMPPLFPPGQETRGLIDPVVAYGLVAVVATFYVAGEVWDALVRRRARRAVIRALVDAGVFPRG